MTQTMQKFDPADFVAVYTLLTSHLKYIRLNLLCVPRSIKSCASKWLLVPFVNPVAWTIAPSVRIVVASIFWRIIRFAETPYAHNTFTRTQRAST